MTIFEEQRICIKFCFKLKKRATETYKLIEEAFGDAALSRSRTFEWFSRFQKGRERVNDDQHTGRLRSLRCEEAVRLKRPERWQNNDWILHVDNARPHTAHVVLQFLAKHSTIQIPHPPYSPDLAPNDFFLYPKLKMKLKGRKFDNVDMIQGESKATLRNLSKSDFISCFDNWKKKDGTARRRVFEWYKRFKEGREETADNERSGRPSTSTTPEKVDKVLELVREDRRITVREVAEEVGISFGSTQSIMKDIFGVRRLNAAFSFPKI
ncbi:hypothetical protein LAZ67_15001262 [Cordylochernes scorpioides]|uniref:Mos1 transposase HTH domain-containing protein n=1 Tax=Cordylochernes scorpioides TaxID=51811 RepID=A0ABY6L8M8_9ARAC|nr:hypothetical protein LAZ67_15001262 [Cordylochernes scorpioides]